MQLLVAVATPLLFHSPIASAATRLIKPSVFVLPLRNMSTLPYKRAKPNSEVASTKTIGTHSGTFQADEALGIWLLRQTPAYRSSPVIRSRDPSVLETCDIVIDVGGVYSHAELKYDHHQREYDEKFEPKVMKDGSVVQRCTKLSASGLVYRHYGMDVIKEYYPGLDQELLKMVRVVRFLLYLDVVLMLHKHMTSVVSFHLGLYKNV